MAHVHQISTSNGGVPKTSVEAAVINDDGVVGDRQRNTAHHGGPDRALCLFSLEVIEGFQAEGHPIEPGFAGENLTISGIDWVTVGPGDRMKIGPEVHIEITSHTSPCSQQKDWFIDGDFTRMLQSRHPGESRVYARVLHGGVITVGDDVRLTD